MTSYSINLKTKNLGKRICNVQCRTFREKLMDKLFGKSSKVLLLIPEDCVQSMSFTDEDEAETQK